MFNNLTKTGRLLVAAIMLVFVAAVIFGIYTAWTAKPKAEARLGKNQTEAAQASGEDAVNTVGKAGDREAETNELTRSNEKEIRDAEGADDAVNPATRDAGLASLCRRASYREHPKCVQRANSR